MTERVGRAERASTLGSAIAAATVVAPLLIFPFEAAVHAAAYPDPARLESEVAALESDSFATNPPPGAIVCVGSSSIRFWHDTLAEDLAPFPVVPRGYGGSTMFDVWTHLDRLVLPLDPAAILLYEGDNDLDFGVAPEDVLGTFDAICTRVHEEFPQCRIFVISIKPSGARWHQWPEVSRANELLRVACAGSELLHFIDVASPMLDGSGTPREELYLPDRLHMNANGYAVWRDRVRSSLLAHAPELQPASPAPLSPKPADEPSPR